MSKNSNIERLPAAWLLPAMLVTGLLLIVVSQSVQAQEPDNGDRHIRAYFQTLDQQARLTLRDSMRQGLRRRSGREGAGAFPEHRLYHAVFLDILTRPALTAAFSATDIQLIESAPSYADSQFLDVAQQALGVACQVIENSRVINPGSATAAVNAFNRARGELDARLDGQFRAVFEGLSESGQLLVEDEVARISRAESLVLTELDLDYLSFTEPEFVMAFLRDSCDNAARLSRLQGPSGKNLKAELTEDLQNGSVQVFRP